MVNKSKHIKKKVQRVCQRPRLQEEQDQAREGRPGNVPEEEYVLARLFP